MQPWKISIGLTATFLGAAGIFGLTELRYLKPYWRVLLSDYWWPMTLYGGLAVVSFAFSIYSAARSLGLSDLGRKVDLVERSIRRGEGGESDLTSSLRGQEKGQYPN